jgi:PD-(D/E)XK endonuclease
MAEHFLHSTSWSDAQLPAAIAAATSWRGVMRELGLDPANGGVTRTIRRRAALLGLDTSHFRGNRSWSDGVLRQAASDSSTWEEVLTTLGLSARTGGERTLVKAHAVRLGLDVSHLGHPAFPAGNSYQLEPGLTHLRRAAESLAAAWFVLCGRNVAFPVEPDTYDLLVDMPDGMKRVQVKTTTFKSRDGWLAQIGRRPYSTGNNAPLVPYDPEIIDLFFIIDGDLVMYLIPSRVVGGRVQILLRTYTQFIIASAAGLMVSSPLAAPPSRGCVIPAGRESYDVPGMVPGPRSL